jgi:hypothetical protein
LGKKYAIGEEEIMPVKTFKDFGGGITIEPKESPCL